MMITYHPDSTGFFGMVVMEYCTCERDPSECPLTLIYRKYYQ